MTRSTSARLMQRVFEQFTSSLGALALTALVLVASNAHAATPAHSIALRYSHTALNSPAAAARLYSSIRFAARQVCGLGGNRANLAELKRAKRCFQETLDDAVSQVNQPQLTALHQSASSKVG